MIYINEYISKSDENSANDVFELFYITSNIYTSMLISRIKKTEQISMKLRNSM